MTTKYSISAASRLTGKSRTTISKHLKQGKLSCEDDGQGAKLIDASELIRVYGDACDFDREEGSRTDQTKASKNKQLIGQGGQVELNTLQDQLNKEVAERERERAHYREQIAHLEQALERAQEGHNRATLLLENHGQGDSGVDQQLAVLQSQFESFQQSAKDEVRAEVRNLPWWRIAFN